MKTAVETVRQNAAAQESGTVPAAPGVGFTLASFLATTGRFTIHNLLSPWTVLFSYGIPVLMYLIFGSGKEYSNFPLPHGNVAAMIMLNMGQYAAVIITCMMGAALAVERVQGWLRTMALTPLGSSRYLLARAASGSLVATTGVFLIYLVGYFTDSRMDATAWVGSFLLIIALSSLTAVLGIVVGLAVGSEQAFGILGGGVALLGFLSGMFIPLDQLSEFFQKLAEFTPLWGINAAAKLPLLGWDQFEWKIAFNLVGWTVILLIGLWWVARRSTKR